MTRRQAVRRHFLGGMVASFAPRVLAPIQIWLGSGMASAQPVGKVHVVGIFHPIRKSNRGGLPLPVPYGIAENLARHGFVVGKNLRIEIVPGDLDPAGKTREEIHEQLKPRARQLLALKPDVLLAPAPTYSGADTLWELTDTVPIVFAGTTPRALEALQATWQRSGNATGVALRYDELLLKRVEIVRELLPRARRLAIVGPMGSIKSDFFRSGPEAAAKRMNLQIVWGDTTAHAGNLEATLAHVLKAKPDALLTIGSYHWEPVMEFEKAHRIPHVDGGDCSIDETAPTICYGEDWDEHYRRFAGIVASILMGVRPADIPVDVTARFKVVVSLKRAREIGVEIPPSLLVRADAIIR